MPKKKENYNNLKSTHPVLSPDGKYRWVYDISMLRNPSILFDVLWVIAISFGIVCLFVLLIRGCEGHLKPVDVWETTQVFLLLTAVFFAIGIVAYFFVAGSYGWRNRVFVADEDFDFIYQFLRQHCPAAR